MRRGAAGSLPLRRRGTDSRPERRDGERAVEEGGRRHSCNCGQARSRCPGDTSIYMRANEVLCLDAGSGQPSGVPLGPLSRNRPKQPRSWFTAMWS